MLSVRDVVLTRAAISPGRGGEEHQRSLHVSRFLCCFASVLQLFVLTQKFRDVMNDYNQVQLGYRQKCTERIQRQLEISELVLPCLVVT